MSEQKSLTSNKITKNVELFKDFRCRKCRAIHIDIFESKTNICFKCKECNEKIIFPKNARKTGALEEIEKLKKGLGYNNEYWQYLEDRKKELENNENMGMELE